MPKQADAMRAMAERYLKLAQATSEPAERIRFLGYARIYSELSEQSERQEAPTPVADSEPTKPT